ncbi:MAG: secondary thiamine-phosphate synthase enzyme YjbQ [Candidatus Paceibacterota bacterium]
MISFSLITKNKREVVDITERVDEACRESAIKSGVCFLFSMHTTTALSVADLDPGTDLDMLDAFEALIPDISYRHPHDPSHTPDHILSAIVGTSLLIPVDKGRVVLGTWQRVVLFEFNGPKERYFRAAFLREE